MKIDESDDSSNTMEQIPSIDSTIDRVKLRSLHKRIWVLSSMGIFMEGFNLFVIGIALPLIKNQYHPSPLQVGIIGASIIIGTILGASLLGRMADLFGRKKILFFNSLIIMIFSILAGVSWNMNVLMIFMLCLGFGLGADYPICASYVAEFMPSRIRGKMLIGSFSFQAAGMLAAAAAGFVVLSLYPSDNAWHWILSMGSIPAVAIFLFRLTVPESPRWCIEHGRPREAIRTISKLSFKSHEKITKIVKKEEKKIKKFHKKQLPFKTLFTKKYIRCTILSAVPWFLMDIATYGIGIFTPIIISSILISKGESHIENVIFSLKGSVFVDLFLVAGFVGNIIFVEKVGRIKLQLVGFLGMTVGLLILALSTYMSTSGIGYLIVLFAGFIIYNFLMNLGPNATTFILPAELYPTKLRASAHGFSAAFAKIGAVIGIIFVPLLNDTFGMGITAIIISITCLLGLIVTYIFRVETTGKSLSELSHLEAGRTMERNM